MALNYFARVFPEKTYWRNIMQLLEEFASVIPIDDKVSPEVIKREFGISKAAFKRAVGRLLKEEKIAIRDGRIYRL